MILAHQSPKSMKFVPYFGDFMTDMSDFYNKTMIIESGYPIQGLNMT